jgi:hypothetical protein
MDTFATRYAYKKGKKLSSTRKKSPKQIQNVVMVIADEFQDPSPTEEMINKRHSKFRTDNNITTLEKEIKKLKLMTDGKDHSGDIIFLKKQIKQLEKRPKKGGQGSFGAQQLTTKSFGRKRTLRKFRNC